MVSWFAAFIFLLLSDTVKCCQPLFVAVAHIESKILMLSLEGAERHQRDTAGSILLILLLGLMLALASDSITTFPIAQSQNRIAAMAHRLTVNEHLK